MYDWIIDFFDKNHEHLDDDVSVWIMQRFVNDIQYNTIMSEMLMVQMMPIDDLKSLLKLKPWPFKLIDYHYVIKNRLSRIKKALLLKTETA